MEMHFTAWDIKPGQCREAAPYGGIFYFNCRMMVVEERFDYSSNVHTVNHMVELTYNNWEQYKMSPVPWKEVINTLSLPEGVLYEMFHCNSLYTKF